MAKLQIFLSVLLVAYVAQARSADRSRRSIVKGLVSKTLNTQVAIASSVATQVNELINQTISVIETKVAAAQQEVETIVSDLECQAESILSAVVEKLSSVQTTINNKISSLETLGAGCDVSSCTSQLTTYQATAEGILVDATSCVENNVAQAKANLKKIQSAIDSEISTLDGYRTEAAACVCDVSTVAQALVAQTCINSVLVKVAACSTSIPAALLKTIVEVKSDIASLALSLPLCAATSEIATLVEGVTVASAEAEECVAALVSAAAA